MTDREARAGGSSPEPLPRGALPVLACIPPILLFGVLGIVFRGSFLEGLTSNMPLVVITAVGSWLALRRWEGKG